MANPAILLAAKAAVLTGSDKRVRSGFGAVIAALCIPLILAVMTAIGIASGGAQHNTAAVHLSFYGGTIPASMPEDYRGYIKQMQESFGELELVFTEINAMAEGAAQDILWVKSMFYSLYFGEERLRLNREEYQDFADCFVRYEERTRMVESTDQGESAAGSELENGTRIEIEETYIVSVAITDKMEIYRNLRERYGKSVTDVQQANAVNVWYLVKQGTSPPMEGDDFTDWNGWENGGTTGKAVPVFDLPASETGAGLVELALSRLGHPYSQSSRGKGNYVDCSYLVLWCYRQVGITLPGTAAAQGRYCVENNLTISKDHLQPGDLVFWSHKPNGRFMNITHVGVYAGEGMVVDASSSKGKVVYRNLFDSDKQVLYGRPQ